MKFEPKSGFLSFWIKMTTFTYPNVTSQKQKDRNIMFLVLTCWTYELGTNKTEKKKQSLRRWRKSKPGFVLGVIKTSNADDRAGSAGVNRNMRGCKVRWGIVLYMNDLMIIMTTRESLALDNLTIWMVRVDDKHFSQRFMATFTRNSSEISLVNCLKWNRGLYLLPLSV